MRQHLPRSLPRRTSVPRSILALLALATAPAIALGCGGGDQRVTQTADSATAYGGGFDSGRVTATGAIDPTTTDTATVDDGAAPAISPAFVLIADSIAGREVYNGAGTCFTCHALDGSGVDPLGSSLRDSTWMHIDGSLLSIARVIRDGLPASSATRRGMPAFGSRLAEAELYRLAAYTYTLSHPGSAVADTAFADSAMMTPGDTMTPPR